MDFDYWYINNFYNKKERNKISSFIEKNFNHFEKNENKATDIDGRQKKKTNTLVIDWIRIKNITGNLESSIYDINMKTFGYNLYPFNNFSAAILNIYNGKNNDEYDWHYDSSKSEKYDCKLTAMVNLSNDYEGGEFMLWPGNCITIKEFIPGTLLVFKSNINHKVTPVTKGIRKTLTLFCHGPKFI